MDRRKFWTLLVRMVFIVAFYLGLSFAVLFAVVLRRGISPYYRAYFPEVIEGTAWRPFVYRVLVPKTVYIFGRITPSEVKSATVNTIKKIARKRSDILLGKHPGYEFEYLTAVVWATLALAASALAWKATLHKVLGYPEHVSFFVPVLGLMSLAPVFLLYGPYMYDTTTLLLFSLSVYALLTRRRGAYYTVFILSTLNKETSLLLVLLFFVAFYEVAKPKHLIVEALLQVLIWSGWRYLLVSVYSNNPGGNVEFHLLDYNLPFFTDFSFKQIRFSLIIGLTLLLVTHRWKDKPVLLRRLFIAGCAFLLPLHLLFAFIDEFRGLLELYPLVLLLSTPTLMESLGYQADRNPRKV